MKKLGACELGVRKHAFGGVAVFQIAIEKKGDTVVQHKHDAHHVMLLAKGSVSVSVGDGTMPAATYTAPEIVNIKAGLHHAVEALTDDVLMYCVHAVPEGIQSIDLIEELLIDRG